MGDDDRTRQQLPHRARGMAEAKTARTASPSLSAETRQRMQAAVEFERSRATGREQKPAGAAREAIAPGPVRQGESAPPASQNQLLPPIQAVPLVIPEPARYPLPAAVAPVTGRPGVLKTADRRRGALTGAIAVALILVAAGSLGVAVARYVNGWAIAAGSVTPALTPAEAAADHKAAVWVTEQVSPTALVSCDPDMCRALTIAGFPASKVQVLGLGPKAPRLTSSAIVIVTPAVLDLFGTSITSLYAPAILATFRSADATVTVQLIDAQGVAAYQTELGVGLKERIAAGHDLANTSNLTMPGVVKQQLLAGAPDSRLLVALENLVTLEPIDILDFGNFPPAGDDTIPLRYMDLAESDQAAHLSDPAYARDLRADLNSVSFAPARPARIVSVNVDGQAALRVEFTAPSPLTGYGT